MCRVCVWSSSWGGTEGEACAVCVCVWSSSWGGTEGEACAVCVCGVVGEGQKVRHVPCVCVE